MGELKQSVRLKHYRCFGENGCELKSVKPLNLVIGRNNAGKSAFLDFVTFLSRGPSIPKDSLLEVQDHLEESLVQNIFPDNRDAGQTGKNPWRMHGQHLVGASFTWVLRPNGVRELVNVAHPDLRDGNQQTRGFRNRRLEPILKERPVLGLQERVCRRLAADRDVVREPSGPGKTMRSNGAGATNLFWKYLMDAKLPQDMVEGQVLEFLNTVFGPDAAFTRIIVQVHELEPGKPNEWEVFLQEENKGLIPLSASGSGLKTVLLVAICLHLVPHVATKEASDYVFLFEELENNLHPTAQRRLFAALEEFAVKEHTNMFVTTHSNVVIDLLSKSDNAQIIHVTHDGKEATTRTLRGYRDKQDVLDDLGAKASDLLQANGLVWLEGPSDRVYFNKWVELFSDGELREGKDYECVFYGGAILKNFEAADPGEHDQDKVNLLHINRSAILIADSDRSGPKGRLKRRVSRLKNEMERMEAYIWVTKGREIENYIPVAVLREHFENSALPPIELYQPFHKPAGGKRRKQKGLPGYLQQRRLHKGKSFDKVGFARSIAPLLTHDQLADCLDLPSRMLQVCERIREWNRR